MPQIGLYFLHGQQMYNVDDDDTQNIFLIQFQISNYKNINFFKTSNGYGEVASGLNRSPLV